MRSNSVLFKLLQFYGTHLHHRGQWRVHARLRKLLRPDVDVNLEVIRGGQKWLLNPSDYMPSEFFWLGTMDSWDTFHLKRFLEPGSVIFDIGANFGYYAITLASTLQRDCQVYAFEPFRPSYERLNKNIALNSLHDTVFPYPLGFSDVVGTGHMVTRAGNSGAARVSIDDNGTPVPLVTLDSFCGDNAIERIDFIKIDVEGYEERLLLGGVKTIVQVKPLIFIELNPPTLTLANSSVERVVETLQGYGYELYLAQRERLLRLRELPRGSNYVNAFCFPKASGTFRI